MSDYLKFTLSKQKLSKSHSRNRSIFGKQSGNELLNSNYSKNPIFGSTNKKWSNQGDRSFFLSKANANIPLRKANVKLSSSIDKSHELSTTKVNFKIKGPILRKHSASKPKPKETTDIMPNIPKSISADKSLKMSSSNFNRQKSIKMIFSAKSRPGKKLGSTKINQDSFLCITNCQAVNFNIYAVFDGHGEVGHKVSDFVKEYFKNNFIDEKCFSRSSIKNSAQIIEIMQKNDFALIKELFLKCSAALRSSYIETNLSGTTAVITFVIDNTLITANAGDSRAVIYKSSKNSAVFI